MIPRTPTSTLFPYQPLFFFFNDTATTEIYTLSLHDALPITHRRHPLRPPERRQAPRARTRSGTTEHSAPTPRAATRGRRQHPAPSRRPLVTSTRRAGVGRGGAGPRLASDGGGA